MTDYAPHQVGRWMSTRLVTTTPKTLVAEALDVMEDHRIRHLPVIEGERLVGLLSNRDAVRLLRGRGPRSPERATVGEVMTHGRLHRAAPSDTVRETTEVMCREKISAMPVVTGDRLVGMVTTEDLLWAFLEAPRDLED